MTHFVLVHGGWHAGWCWDEQIRALEQHGHSATAVTLPSDDLDAGAQTYADVIAGAVRTPGEDVIVGHSLAGLAIPLVAERVPVRALVFLAALLPEPGRSWREQLAAGRPMADWFYDNALPHQQRDNLGRTYWPTDIASELFFHDCPQPHVAANKLRPQSPTPILETTPLQQFPTIPMHYIGCRGDRAVSASWSEHTARERLGTDVAWIDGSHSPFLASPEPLADLLISLTSTLEVR
jgi:hypothetical protein